MRVEGYEEGAKKGEEKDRFSAATLANQPVHARGGVCQALFPAESEVAGSAITG